MTTWTPATKQNETWIGEPTPPKRVFSPAVFSHAFYNGKLVFAIGFGVWDVQPKPSETWAAV